MSASLVLAMFLLLPGASNTSAKEFPFYPGGRLEITATVPGNVRIIGWPKAMVRVELEKIVHYEDPQESANAISLIPVRVVHTPSTARITVSSPGFDAEVHLVVYAPMQKTDMIIKMLQGNLSITSLNGSVEATLEAGNIDARDLAGYYSIVTKSGDLNFDLLGTRWLGYGLSAMTRRGSVRLLVPINYSAVLQLETKEGAIAVDFPDQEIDGESVPLQPVAAKKSQSLNAPIGAGGIPVRVGTFYGNISLTRK